MSDGPIEFMGEEAGHDVPSTEFGGADGLIQPEDGTVLRGDPGASGGHRITEDAGKREYVSEKLQIAARVGMSPLSMREQITGIADDEEIVDPHTGRAVGQGAYKKASGERGELSDLQE